MVMNSKYFFALVAVGGLACATSETFKALSTLGTPECRGHLKNSLIFSVVAAYSCLGAAMLTSLEP